MAEKDAKKSCGYCDNYAPMMSSEFKGTCRVLPGEKPGQRGKMVKYDTDASECPQFKAIAIMRRVDVSQGSGWDSILGARASTVFETTEESKTDRLVWERHAKEHEQK